MEQKFKKWLIGRGYSEVGAATSYSRAINQISDHYSKNTGKTIDIYALKEQSTISQIAHDYSQSGRFSRFGYEQHGRYRAAISRYSEFFVHNNENLETDEIIPIDINNDFEEIEISRTNFAYERDLQTTLCAQISDLFPGFKIFGEANAGVEYSIEGRRLDVLLEHEESGDLLIVELKSGRADYKIFGQISMYIGIIQKKYPNKSVKGVVIAGIIDDSLRQACEITDKISLKLYRMSIELEDA